MNDIQLSADVLMDRFAWQFKAGRFICGSVPPEWLPELTRLMAAIDALIPVQAEERSGFYWTDIKEKRGGLSASYSAPMEFDQEIAEMIDQTERRLWKLP